MMQKQIDHFPDSLPYLSGLPVDLRHRIFRYLEEPLPLKSSGKVLIQPMFEKIVKQILGMKYSSDGTVTAAIANPGRSALRCLGVVDLISMCKFYFTRFQLFHFEVIY